MRHKTLRLVIPVTVALASALGFAQGQPARAVTIQELTVPTDRLPDGCTLKFIEPARQEVIAKAGARETFRMIPATPSLQPSSAVSNPWTGTDRRILADLRQRIDGHGAIRFPDAPPLSRTETSAIHLKFADGVEEGYAATYEQANRGDLGVWAVRFTSVTEQNRQPLSAWRNGPNALVLDIGLIRVAQFGPSGGGCALAIQAHLKALAGMTRAK